MLNLINWITDSLFKQYWEQINEPKTSNIGQDR